MQAGISNDKIRYLKPSMKGIAFVNCQFQAKLPTQRHWFQIELKGYHPPSLTKLAKGGHINAE